MRSELLGTWVSDPDDLEGIAAFGKVILHFMADGQFSYSAKERGKEQIILMTYRIDGNKILTDQPSHPNEVASEYELKDGELVVSFGGKKCRYRRPPCAGPANL